MSLMKPPISKIVRAEKTTQNIDDFKVIIVGLIIFVCMLLFHYWTIPNLNKVKNNTSNYEVNK